MEKESIVTDKKKIIVIALSACLLYAVSAGLRSIYGIMLDVIAEETGIAYATVSFAIAIGQLVFGVAQPAFGVVALKKSNTYVLVVGSLMMAVGLLMIPFCSTVRMLVLFLGIILPIGTGAVSFGMIMGAVTPKLGEAKATMVSGFVNASSGMGSIVFSPIMQTAFAAVGLKITMIGFAIFTALLVPVSMIVGGKQEKENVNHSGKNKSIMPLIKRALKDKNYICLLIGFFTCGFHMAIVETHLYSQVLSYGVADSTAALAFSIYGFASVAGSLFSGFMCSKV